MHRPGLLIPSYHETVIRTRETMTEKNNFIVKTHDAKAGDITKALKAAGVDVVSVALVHTETADTENDRSPDASRD